MEELFFEIPDFPAYKIGNKGTVWNDRTGSKMMLSRTRHGDYKVSLTNEYGRMTFAVRVLVAEACVPRPDEASDTVIVLDNHRSNLRHDNLAWRPRWFAWKYNRQFQNDPPPHFIDIPVTNSLTDITHRNILECSMDEGLLMEDVWRSCNTGAAIYPTQASYFFPKLEESIR